MLVAPIAFVINLICYCTVIEFITGIFYLLSLSRDCTMYFVCTKKNLACYLAFSHVLSNRHVV